MSQAHQPDLYRIGARIRGLREIREISQVTLAERCYSTQAAVSGWERGAWAPSRSNQHRISDALGTSRSILFRELVEAENRAAA